MVEHGKLRIGLAAMVACAMIAAGCGEGSDEAPGDMQPTSSVKTDGPAAGRFVPNEAIVTFRSPPDWSTRRTLGGHRIAPVLALGTRTYLVRFDDLVARAAGGAATLSAISALSSVTDEVESAVVNRIVPLAAAPTDPLFYPYQNWNYQAVRLPEAWNLITGTPGVRIAVLDTGKTAHPDLVWGTGYDALDGDGDPSDAFEYHHGVHVAGIIGARANNGLGGAGVCWNCTVVPVRVSNSQGAPLANVTAGIRWVAGYYSDPQLPAGPRRAEVINMSLSISGPCSGAEDVNLISAAITDAIGRGVTVVASAGNSNASMSGFPGNCPGVISVAASQPDGQLAPYSDRGADVDLTAPGGGYNNQSNGWFLRGADVGPSPCPKTGMANPSYPGFGSDPYLGTNGVVSSWSTGLPSGQLSFADHCYRYLSGTSMSAPHVAGVVGLMLSVAPGLSPSLITRYLTDTANPTGVTCPQPGQCGAGMLDAFRAVQAAQNGLSDIDLTPTSLTFPITPLNTVSAPIGITVKNTLTASLTASFTSPTPSLLLSCASGTCTCPTTSTCQVIVAPGQQAILNVSYAPGGIQPFSSALTVQSNDPNRASFTVPVTATTFSQASISPDIVHFGYVNVGSTSSGQTAQLVNIGTAPLVVSSLSATIDVAHYSITPAFALPVTVPPGGVVSVTIRCAPISPGRKILRLGFVSNATIPDAPVDVRCDATVPDARVVIDYPGPDFGPQPVYELATRAMRVYNVSTGPTSLTFSLTRPFWPFSLNCSSGCTCTDATCSGSVFSGGSPAMLQLGYMPTNLGTDSVTFTFTSNSPGLPVQQLTATGQGVLPPE